MCYCLFTSLWVARTIGQKQSIELKLVEVIVPRHAHHLDTAPDQTTDDIRLHAAVDEDDTRGFTI